MTSPAPHPEPIPGRTDLFLVRDFLSLDECADFIRRSEERGYEEAAISAGKQQVIVKEVRNNDRILWDDRENRGQSEAPPVSRTPMKGENPPSEVSDVEAAKIFG